MNALYNGSLRIKMSYFYPEESGAELKWLTVVQHYTEIFDSVTWVSPNIQLYLAFICDLVTRQPGDPATWRPQIMQP